MIIKPKITIIKQDKSLERHLSLSDFNLIHTSSSISEGVVNLNQNCPHVLMLGLQLKDGEGIKIIKHIITNLNLFYDLSHIFILSRFLDQYIENDILNLLSNTTIECHFFCKKEDYYSPEVIINRLEIIKYGFIKNEKFIAEAPILSLKTIIYYKLNTYGISKSNKYRECIARAIEEIIVENVYDFKIENIYDSVIMSFDYDFEEKSLDAIRKGIKDLIKNAFKKNPNAFAAYRSQTGKATPTNKTFIKYLANSIREEYPDLCPEI